MGPAKGRHFSPDAIKIMQVALDVAWDSMSPEEQAQSARSLLASRILDAAATGERNPTRLILAALKSDEAQDASAKTSSTNLADIESI
jgi:hypothetical protein